MLTPDDDDLADRVHVALVAFGRPVTGSEVCFFGRVASRKIRHADVRAALERLVADGRAEKIFRVEPFRFGGAQRVERTYYQSIESILKRRI